MSSPTPRPRVSSCASTAPRPRSAAPRPAAPAARRFVSGKKKQNTAKTTTISDGSGRLLWSGADRPGRMHDQTAMRTEGIAEQLCLHPQVKAKVDEGRRGIQRPGQRLPQPGPGTATQAEEQSAAEQQLCLARGAPTAVLRADLRGAHHRRGEEVAAAPAVPRPARFLRRNPRRRRRTGPRPRGPQTHPLAHEHRTRAAWKAAC
ncbi:transposase family protein [Streptomyces sp. NPDC002403]